MKRTVLFAFLLACGCGGAHEGTRSSPAPQVEVGQSVHDALARELVDLHAAAVELQAAAPTHAWDAVADAAAIDAMKGAWRRARVAYEHVEGAVAPNFPDIDGAIDARYDDHLAQLGGAGDDDLFDGEGVTGMHAIERILYADRIPERVVAFERTLPGYRPAAFPSTDAEAAAFKTKLVQRLIDDLARLETSWNDAQLDVGTAYLGLVSLMQEQQEKVDKAATGEEESRYAQMTMFDLRNNLVGTRAVYDQFRAWVRAHDGGAALDDAITARMQGLSDVYAQYPGDAIPAPPPTWSADAPSDADLATPFGKLYLAVRGAVDPRDEGSLVSDMRDVGELLGF